jgi:hypothetical protein
MKRSHTFLAQLIPEIANAIQCLHGNGIIHCDIKPANILVRGLEPLDLVLADFGMSSILASDMSRKMTTVKGTPMYSAPESFSGVAGRPCDWWGLGMILLEALLGAHPFEGLSDAKIIRKLTLGDVEVPDFLGDEWGALLKGLLTKNDALRWGKGEVDRWLAGERDIPARYGETPGAMFLQAPFHFGGADYHSAEDIARAFATHESPWLAPGDYLRFLRAWFESGMKFDEAEKIVSSAETNDPQLALFRFVNENANLPFSIMGHAIDSANLRLFLGRAIRGEASGAEETVVAMMGDGRLKAFHEEYARFRAGDRGIAALLDLMEKRDRDTQWAYFYPLQTPDGYLWPRDADAGTLEGRARCLCEIGAIPARRGEIEEIESAFRLPAELLSKLGAASTYASAMTRLDLWRVKGLMIPKTPDVPQAAWEEMGVDEYERTAMRLYFGHTNTALKALDDLVESMGVFENGREPSNPLTQYVIGKLNMLRERKITCDDLRFVAKASELLAEREKIRRARLKLDAAGAVALALSVWLVFFAAGRHSYRNLGVMTFFIFICGLFPLMKFAKDAEMDSPLLFVPAVLPAFIALAALNAMNGPYTPSRETESYALRLAPYLLTYMWAVIGFAAMDTVYLFRMGQNADLVMGECQAYAQSGERP